MTNGVFEKQAAERVADFVRRVEGEAQGSVRQPLHPPRLASFLPRVVRLTSSELHASTEYYSGELWGESPNSTDDDDLIRRLAAVEDAEPIWVTTPFPGQILPVGFYFATRVGRYVLNEAYERDVYLVASHPQVIVGTITGNVGGGWYTFAALRWQENLTYTTDFGGGIGFASGSNATTRIADTDYQFGDALELNEHATVPNGTRVWLMPAQIIDGEILYLFVYDRHLEIWDGAEFDSLDVVGLEISHWDIDSVVDDGDYTAYPVRRPTDELQVPFWRPHVGYPAGGVWTLSTGIGSGGHFFSDNLLANWQLLTHDKIGGDFDFGTW